VNRSFYDSSLAGAVKRIAPLTLEDERELSLRAAEGCSRSFDRLVNAHLLLVVSIAREHGRFGLPLEDLIGEGMLGLVEAARRYEPGRGVRLAAYADWWIRGYVRRYTISNRRIVRPPSSRSARKLLSHLRRTQRDLARAGAVQTDEVAEALGVRPRDVEEVESILSGRDLAIDDPSVSIASETLSPEAEVANEEAQRTSRATLQRAVNSLNQRQRFVLTKRYLTGDGLVPLASVARTLGISRERARQIEQAAREKLRRMVA